MLTRLFEHNNWANRLLIEACSALSDEELDAEPNRGSTWSVRVILSHIVVCQERYLALLTLPADARQDVQLSFNELQEAARTSGEALLSLVKDQSGGQLEGQVHTTDGYSVEPWVVMVQAINHGTEHRRQICARLRGMGHTPPRLDGWAFGELEGALIPTTG